MARTIEEKRKLLSEKIEKLKKEKSVIDKKEKAVAKKERTRTLIQIGAILAQDKYRELLAFLQDDTEKDTIHKIQNHLLKLATEHSKKEKINK